jgi:hypothetical protein
VGWVGDAVGGDAAGRALNLSAATPWSEPSVGFAAASAPLPWGVLHHAGFVSRAVTPSALHQGAVLGVLSYGTAGTTGLTGGGALTTTTTGAGGLALGASGVMMGGGGPILLAVVHL